MHWSGEEMHDGRRCGMCHDGNISFSVEEDCEICHAEE